ncbi:hypothetical protein SMB554_22120 (plasmid) [Sinorhizobium meliloti]|nr:hypothetical protein SMB554_22120 [Sinorhizobium meliloti]
MNARERRHLSLLTTQRKVRWASVKSAEVHFSLASDSLERDAFRRNRKGDSFFCANQIHHSGR